MGCCLGGPAPHDYVVFSYIFKDISVSYSYEACGHSYNYTEARVFYTDVYCSNAYGDVVCGSCPQNLDTDESNESDLGSSALGWSFMVPALISFVMLQV